MISDREDDRHRSRSFEIPTLLMLVPESCRARRTRPFAVALQASLFSNVSQ